MSVLTAGERVAPLKSDTNGDEQVDILDLQVLVSRMLLIQGEGTAEGSVCVLDFQRALKEARLPAQPASAQSPKSKCQGTFFNHQIFQKDVKPVHQAAAPLALMLVFARGVFQPPVRKVLPPCNERYLFKLTPNAPPVLA